MQRWKKLQRKKSFQLIRVINVSFKNNLHITITKNMTLTHEKKNQKYSFSRNNIGKEKKTSENIITDQNIWLIFFQYLLR